MDNFNIGYFEIWTQILTDLIPAWSPPSITTLLISVVWLFCKPWRFTSDALCIGTFIVLGVTLVTSWGGWFILSCLYWYLVALEIKKTSVKKSFLIR